MPALPRERPGQPREVAGRRLRPARVVGVSAVQVDEQPAERPHVLIVVPDDVEEGTRLAPAQEVQVARRDLPASDVAVPPQPQQLGLHGREPRVRHAVSEDAPDDRQEVEVAFVEGRIGAGHAEPGDEEGPVEPPAVVRDQPAPLRDPRCQLREERGLIGMVREEQLDLAEQAALPPAKADKEREGPRRGREAGRLRVEAEQGSVGRRLAREGREAISIDRQQRRWRFDHDE